MGKYTINTTLREALEDQRFVHLLEEYCPLVFSHPRFIEGYDFTFQEIIDMNLGAIAGIPKAQVKKMVKRSLELE